MRRKTLRWAALALALAGLTCRDDHPIGPGAAGRAVFDVRAFALFAPGDPPVPVESLEVVFRRTDEFIAFADTVDLVAAAQGDSFVVSLAVPLDETPQDFRLTLRAFGGGIAWYEADTVVTLAQGANAPLAPLVRYVGPGANAASVLLVMPTTRMVGGVATPLSATVHDSSGAPLSGVPVGFRVGNAGVATVSGALLNSATVTGAQPIRDSTWVYAETPTHLRDSVRVRVVPPPAQLETVSGSGQSGPPGLALGAPFTVRVLDALGGPFAGEIVTWSVSAGAGTLSATSTVTDSAGLAATTLTPTSLGVVAVEAAAPGLAGSPQTFSATGTGGNAITVVSGNAQSDTVGAALLPLVVRVADGQNNPVAGAQVAWTRVVGTGSLSADTTTTGGTGQTQVVYTLGLVPGVDSVRAQLVGSPANVLFGASTLPGSLGSVTLDRTRDTIAQAGTLQYTATLRDAQGNVVSGTVTWSSTTPVVASVSPTGLATALTGGTTRIIAAAGGRADTADLYVRALATIAARPADTVVTAIGDSLLLGATALSNFGDTVTTGLVIRYASATPTVATVNALTGRVHLIGAGNAVVLVRDSVSGLQGTATLRVNQVAASLANTPADSIVVGVSGRGQIVARAFDRNGYPIPGRSFGWVSRAPTIATVDQAGMVTGVALGQAWIVDSLVEPGAGVFTDSTLVAVVALPPAVVQWAYDSTAVGNGSSLAVALSLTRTSPTPVVVRMTSSDSFIAKPTVRLVTIPANSPGTTATINGLAAGRVDLIAVDTAGVYLSDTMTVTVVSTIEFREIGSFSRQPNFYVNNNQTYRGQVFLSDPAPPGGLGVTFEYGVPGKSVISPSPAIIPAGQLSADVLIQGVGAGRDSVVPTSGGFVGKFSYVYVAPESLRLQLPYPYTGVLGVGQTFDPYVQYTYAMDHPQVVSLTLTPAGIGAVPDTVTVPTSTTYRYFTVRGTTLGRAILTASAPGWISDTATVTVSTPRLYAYGTASIVAGDPTRGYWGVYSGDSLDYQHNVFAPVAVTAVSRNPAAVVVELPSDTIPPGTYAATASNALRAEPTAGGDSAWIVLTATGYLPDSFLVRVTAPTLTFQIGYPYNGRVPLGTRYQNAGYVSIPYARPDTFWVVLGHTRRGVLGGPDSVAVLPGQTYRYFDVQGDSLGSDTVSVARASGYVVSGGPFGYGVGPLRVRPYSYPSTLYTISAPQLVSALAEDSATGFAGYYTLLAPLTVTLVPRNPGAIALDSGRVVIPAGTWVSGYDTLRAAGVDTVGSRIVASAPGAATDSSGLIRVYPTPLSVQIAYPYTVSQGLRLEGNRVHVTGGNVPDTVRVALSHTNPAAFALTRDTLVIPRGQAYSDYFEIRALDSTGTDTIVATAVGYVTAAGTIATQPSRLDVIDPGANHLTTEAPYRMTTYVETRSGWGLNPISPVTFTIVSSDPGVILIDSAATVNPTGDTATAVVDTNRTYAYFKVRFVGTGTARLRVSAPGFDADSTYLITVTGPSLNLSYTSLTVGQGQIFTSQRVYVDNPVASPLVVRLLRSDSLLPPANQAFALAADSVVIGTGQTYSPFFDITGNAIGSANLVARATGGYSQATTVVSVGQPRLQASTPTITLYVGQRPPSVTISTLDQSGQTRIVANPLVIAATASDTAVAQPDSATRTLAARQATTSFPLRPRRKGSVDVVYTAPGYTPDTTVVTVDTAKLDLQNPPNGLGPGQVATTTMYVQVPYTTDSALVVSLSSTNPGVLTVPAQATIPAGSNYAYFTVTGTGTGVASVVVSAPHSYPDTLAVRISRPRLGVTVTAAANAGQRYTFTIAARDSLNTQRVLATPLTVSLASSDPGHTQFDSLTTTIAAGQSSVTMGVTFDTAGTYVVAASAAGYDAGSDTTAVSGALVRMVSGNLFAPQTVTIPTGRTITWRNDDAVTHTTTADGASPLWNSGNRTPGQTYQRTFGTAGTFTYHCTIHAGMTGTIVVQ